jgi:hypothetical protein
VTRGFAPSEAEARAVLAAQARDGASPKAARMRAGTVHTPPWLSRFVAQAADQLLRGELGLSHGIADRELGVLDPACGPGVFLASALAVGTGRGAGPGCVLGLERDREAAELAQATLAQSYREAGWPLEIQHADTLHDWLPREIATRAPCWLVLGNPPWVGSAQAAPAAWLAGLLDDFRRDFDGAPLGERKVGVLADSYVRFLRWAAELARCAERGAVLGLVTSGAYLDGPVHRGLRGALRRWFDAVHVLDLGGSALLARAQGRDDNVFGVRPNVAVLLAARRSGHDERALGRVHYRRVTGSLEDKVEALGAASSLQEGAVALAPQGPLQRFVPAPRVPADYAAWPSLAEILPFHREGVQTNRDAVVVDQDRGRLLERLREFARGGLGADLAPALLQKPHYDPTVARRAAALALEADPAGEALLRPLQYRPFDRRWFVALAPLCHRPRPELLSSVDRSELVLISARKDRGALPWACFGAARTVIDNCYLSTRSSCRARAFPTHRADGSPNVDRRVLARYAERVGREPSALQMTQYALSWLASAEYRERHDAALKADYPRIPWPSDSGGFDARVALGGALAEQLDLAAPPAVAEDATQLQLGHHRVRVPPGLAAAIEACSRA